MEPLKILATKKFSFLPFGNFTISMAKNPKNSPNVLDFNTLSIFQDSRVKVTEHGDNEIVKMMKKYKTDILIDGIEFYTRLGDDICRVDHVKIQKLVSDEYHRDYYEGTYVKNIKPEDETEDEVA